MMDNREDACFSIEGFERAVKQLGCDPTIMPPQLWPRMAVSLSMRLAEAAGQLTGHMANAVVPVRTEDERPPIELARVGKHLADILLLTQQINALLGKTMPELCSYAVGCLRVNNLHQQGQFNGQIQKADEQRDHEADRGVEGGPAS